MTQTITPAPVRKSIRVAATPERAFAVFTRNMTRWWPVTHSIGTSPLKEAIIEPQEGGRWYERGEDGSECQWGRVLVWDPPARLVLAWQIDGQWRFDPDLVTEVDVRFIPDGADGTRVELEHRNIDRFGAHSEATRGAFDSPQGWSGILENFAGVVAEG